MFPSINALHEYGHIYLHCVVNIIATSSQINLALIGDIKRKIRHVLITALNIQRNIERRICSVRRLSDLR